MLQLAKELGISDRGLAKKCERHTVLVPYRGYWAKIDAGKKARKYILPTSNDESLENIYFSKVQDAQKSIEKIVDFPLPEDLKEKINSFDIETTTQKRHTLISETRKAMSKEAHESLWLCRIT